MIARTFGASGAHVCYGKEYDGDGALPEPAVVVQVDADGLVCIEQRDHRVVMTPEQFKEVVKAERMARKNWEAEQK